MDHKTTDPVIEDLLRWLKENLPPDVEEEAIFKKVRRVQKVFDLLIGLSFEEFYNHAISLQQKQLTPNSEDIDDEDDVVDVEKAPVTLEETVNDRLKSMKEYVSSNEEKLMKNKKLNLSRAKLNLKKEQYQLITSIKLDGCADLISRYNHLLSKK